MANTMKFLIQHQSCAIQTFTILQIIRGGKVLRFSQIDR